MLKKVRSLCSSMNGKVLLWHCVHYVQYLFIFAVYFYLQLYVADLTVVGVNRTCNVSITECNYI